jgi:hypothetical protein
MYPFEQFEATSLYAVNGLSLFSNLSLILGLNLLLMLMLLSNSNLKLPLRVARLLNKFFLKRPSDYVVCVIYLFWQDDEIPDDVVCQSVSSPVPIIGTAVLVVLSIAYFYWQYECSRPVGSAVSRHQNLNGRAVLTRYPEPRTGDKAVLPPPNQQKTTNQGDVDFERPGSPYTYWSDCKSLTPPVHGRSQLESWLANRPPHYTDRNWTLPERLFLYWNQEVTLKTGQRGIVMPRWEEGGQRFFPLPPARPIANNSVSAAAPQSTPAATFSQADLGNYAAQNARLVFGTFDEFATSTNVFLIDFEMTLGPTRDFVLACVLNASTCDPYGRGIAIWLIVSVLKISYAFYKANYLFLEYYLTCIVRLTASFAKRGSQ